MPALLSELLFAQNMNAKSLEPSPKMRGSYALGSAQSPDTAGQHAPSFKDTMAQESQSKSRTAQQRSEPQEARRADADRSEAAKPAAEEDLRNARTQEQAKPAVEKAKPAEEATAGSEEPETEGYGNSDPMPVWLPLPGFLASEPVTAAASAGPATEITSAHPQGALAWGRWLVQSPQGVLPGATAGEIDMTAESLMDADGNPLNGLLLKSGEAGTTLLNNLPEKPVTLAATAFANLFNLDGGNGKPLSLSNTQLGRLEGLHAMTAASVSESAAAIPIPQASVNSPALFGLGDAGAKPINLSVSFGQPQWAAAVAERSAQLFSQNIQSAEIQLDPPELGRMTVQVQVHNNDQASVTFTSANASVRDALDQSGQRLRDLLAEQGLNLVNVDVSDQRTPQRDAEGGEGGTASGPSADESEMSPPVEVTLNVNSGVDHYV